MSQNKFTPRSDRRGNAAFPSSRKLSGRSLLQYSLLLILAFTFSGCSSSSDPGVSNANSTGPTNPTIPGPPNNDCPDCEFIAFYTDVLSGPTSGGENNNGAYLSIFGKYFGESSGLGTNTKVFINDIEVADYLYMGPAGGRTDIEQLSVQVGNVTSGDISLQVNGVKGNTGLNFTVQPGNIIYVSLDGDDSTGTINNVAKPYRTLQDTSGEGVWENIANPGDFIVLRGGEWTDEGRNGRFLRTTNNSGTQPTGSVGSGPITIMGYPGENILIHSSEFGGIANGAGVDWLTLSNLRIEGGDSTVKDGPINMQWGSDYWRIVNNELFNWDADTEARAGGIAGNGNNVKLLGNRIYGIGGGTKNHGIYIDFDGGPVTVDNIEIGWNYIYNITGGNIIQTYSAGGDITNVYIHHNFLDGGTRYGLNIGAETQGDIYIWDNVVKNSAYAGLRTDTNYPIGEIYVFNNTFHNVDTADASGAAIKNTANLGAVIFEFKNNLVIPSANSSGYTSPDNSSGWGAGIFENNFWYGKGAAPGLDSSPVAGSGTSDPGFVDVNNGDLHLSSTSPGRNTGVLPTVGILTDYDGNPRTMGVSIDVGAYEFIE